MWVWDRVEERREETNSVAQGDADVGDGGCEGYAGHSFDGYVSWRFVGWSVASLLQDGILKIWWM